MVSSPYLEAIQSLGGVTPGDKFKKLNNLSNLISSTSNGKDGGSGDLQTIPPLLVPLVRIPAAIKSKNYDYIIEALKSDDNFVVNEALKAKFFFKPSNPNLKANFFKEKVMPFVSLQTRFKIIKKLSIKLIKDEKTAEEFYNEFVELYGGKTAMPLLIACSESFTYNKVLKHKVVFPIGILEIIFRIKPNLIVRYLQLGNLKNDNNTQDREIHQISLDQYARFLPKLIKNHIQDFIVLFEYGNWNRWCIGDNYLIKLENKKKILFIKNAKDKLIQKPNVFENLLGFEFVCKKLIESDFEAMYENFFPKKLSEFSIHTLINKLKYYPEDKKYNLLAKTFEKLYGVDILDDLKRLENSDFLLSMPASLREKQALRLVEKNKFESYEPFNLINDWRCYLPPVDSIPLFKDDIKKESDADKRGSLISKMIYSCYVYDDKNQLNKVLKYYYERHINEKVVVLEKLFDTIFDYWIEKLNSDNWIILKDIVLSAYVKNQFLKIRSNIINSFLEGLLRYILQNFDKTMDKELQDLYSYVINVIIDFKVNCDHGWNMDTNSFNFLKEDSRLEQEVLNKILNTIPINYPADHKIWKDSDWKKFYIIDTALESMVDFNTRNIKEPSIDSNVSSSDNVIKEFHLSSYPWLFDLIKEVFLKEPHRYLNYGKELQDFLKCLKPEIYKVESVKSIGIEEVFDLLRRNPEEVIKNWKDYLEKAIDSLSRRYYRSAIAVQFIAATKWYKDIPIFFANHALKSLEEKRSILILGILFDGETFSKVVTPLIPKDSKLDVQCIDAKQNYDIVKEIQSAIIMTNPPCDLDTILSFCQGDHLSLGIKCLADAAKRMPLPIILEFSKLLMTERVALKQHGYHIVAQVSPRKEWLELLTESWEKEKHYSIREMLASKILNAFKNDPCDASFNLIKKRINELTLEEKDTFESFLNVNWVDKDYIGEYFAVICKKIVDLSLENPEQCVDSYICSVLNSFDKKYIKCIDESILLEVFDRYFYIPNSSTTCETVQRFLINNYLLLAEEENLDRRLDFVAVILKKLITKWTEPIVKRISLYSVEYSLRNFIKNLLYEMSKKPFPNYESVIKNFSEIFSLSLLPCQYPDIYIMLEFYNLHFSNPSPKVFGLKCSKKLSELVKLFSTEIILINIGNCLQEIINRVRTIIIDTTDYLLDFVVGLIEGDQVYGSIVSMNLLLLYWNPYESYANDPRCESIFKTFDASKSNTVLQYSINNFLSNVQ